MIEIKNAIKEQNKEIARLIMMAMTDECCKYFCGEGYGLDDFYRMMCHLVEVKDSSFLPKKSLRKRAGRGIVFLALRRTSEWRNWQTR